MKIDIFIIFIFGLAFCGLWGFALAQIRTYQCVKMLRQTYPLWLKLTLSILTSGYIGLWGSTYFHLIFKCFTGQRCHATQNGELIYLAIFGCYVGLYEILFGLIHHKFLKNEKFQ